MSYDALDTLDDLLARELQAAHELARILDREAVAIRNRDAEALNDVVPQKLQGLKVLEELEHQRNALSSPDNANTPPNESSRLWDQVLKVIRVCDRKNQLNGAMLSLRQAHTQRALDLIADRDSAQLTYGADGSAKPDSGHFGTSVSA